MNRPDDAKAFFRVWGDLPQAAPGSDASTREALRRLPPLPDAPRVLDLGCGPGRQTLALARALPNAHIVALDLHEPFLERLGRRAREEGFADRVETRLQSMDAIEEPPGSVDLVWSEGAAYAVGVERALSLWRPLLRPGGLLAFTELSWATDERPDGARQFMESEYPAMRGVAQNVALANRCGYEVLDHFALPASDWWVGFYGPLEARVAELRSDADVDQSLAAVLQEAEREIEVFRAFGSSYGYVFFLLRTPIRT